MVKYEPQCTYEIRSFEDKFLFWDKTFYVIVKLNNRHSHDSGYRVEFFLAKNICYDNICWTKFKHSTKYWSFEGAKRDLNKILITKDSCSDVINDLSIEYSTDNNSMILEDPLEQKFKKLECSEYGVRNVMKKHFKG